MLGYPDDVKIRKPFTTYITLGLWLEENLPSTRILDVIHIEVDYVVGMFSDILSSSACAGLKRDTKRISGIALYYHPASIKGTCKVP